MDLLSFLLALQSSVLGNLTADITLALILIIVGIIIIVLVKILLVFIPAILIAFLVWFFTGSIFWAGIAFLVVAALSLLSRL